MTDFGAGIHLDEQLDFSVDSTGDLDGESGIDELQKDLAYNMILNLQEFLGSPPTSTLEAQIVGRAKQVANADSRIDVVVSGETEVSFDSSNEEIELSMTVIANGEEQNLVFNV